MSLEQEIEEAPAPSDEELKSVAQLAAALVETEATLVAHEAEGKRLAEERRRISEVDLPDAMTAVGMANFTLTDGRRIGIEHVIGASITKEKAPEAFAWLEETGNDAIIKRSITVEFGKGEGVLAMGLLNYLKNAYAQQKRRDKRGVHPQTLGAFVREQLKTREDFPRAVFGVFELRRAVIESPAGRDKKKSGDSEL